MPLPDLRLPCEICGAEVAAAGRASTPGVAGAFGALPVGSGAATPDGLFWACATCQREVAGWPPDKLRARLEDARKRGPSPALWRASPPSRRPAPPAPVEVSPEIEASVGIAVDDLAALYVLDSITGFGPQKFRELHEHGLRPTDVVRDPSRIPTTGKRGDALRSQLGATFEKLLPSCRARAANQIVAAHRLRATILTYGHRAYPRAVLASNNPVPVLYARGSLDVFAESIAVACVGSRNIRPPYADLHAAFARTACGLDFTVVSGFATGADTIGHEAAWKAGGRTVCVMPGGLDRPFPPENKALWQALLAYPGAVFVSEFAFGMAAAALTLRKRNKLIVAFSRGVLVSQSANDGGAMNAYRFALEQRKPVATFDADDTAETSGNRRIAADAKAGATSFPKVSDPETYTRWLRRLSSST